MPSRRQFLSTAGRASLASLVGIAGCVGGRSKGSRLDGYPEGVDRTADWPFPGHDARNTRHDPKARPVTEPTEVWRAPIDLSAIAPTVADGTVYTPHLRAVDADDGTVRWRYETSPWHAPVVADGRVYTGGGDDDPPLVALDAKTGQVAWSALSPDVGSLSTAPTFNHDRRLVYVGVQDTIYGIEVDSGDVRWTYDVFGEVHAVASYARVGVVAVTESGEVYAFGESGEEYWRANLNAPVQCAPTLGEDAMYVADMNGRVHALDYCGGGQKWTKTVVNGFVRNGTALAGDVVLTSEPSLTALDAETGETLAMFRSGDTESGSCGPIVVGDVVYYGTNAGNLYALRLENGALGWKFSKIWKRHLNGYVGHSLAASYGRIYAPTMPNGQSGGEQSLVAVGQSE